MTTLLLLLPAFVWIISMVLTWRLGQKVGHEAGYVLGRTHMDAEWRKLFHVLGQKGLGDQEAEKP